AGARRLLRLVGAQRQLAGLDGAPPLRPALGDRRDRAARALLELAVDLALDALPAALLLGAQAPLGEGLDQRRHRELVVDRSQEPQRAHRLAPVLRRQVAADEVEQRARAEAAR